MVGGGEGPRSAHQQSHMVGSTWASRKPGTEREEFVPAKKQKAEFEVGDGPMARRPEDTVPLLIFDFWLASYKST